jgi:hypothetical protein
MFTREIRMFRIEQSGWVKMRRNFTSWGKCKLLRIRLRPDRSNCYPPRKLETSRDSAPRARAGHNRKSSKHFVSGQRSVFWLDQDC